MYPSDVPCSRKEFTPSVPHLDFQKPHLKNQKWQFLHILNFYPYISLQSPTSLFVRKGWKKEKNLILLEYIRNCSVYINTYLPYFIHSFEQGFKKKENKNLILLGSNS
jgi:hypothetical protein